MKRFCFIVDDIQKNQKGIYDRVNKFSNYLPILKWLKNYGKFKLFCDIVAGFSLALTLTPQSIAYAALMGLSPEYGLNSVFVGCMLYSLFGTIKEVSIGPAAVISVITLEYISDVNGDFAILLTFLAGLTEILMGLLKLGFLINYISLPVSCGYITALAIIICCSQLKGIFGMHFKSISFFDNLYKVMINLPNTRFGDTIVGVSCILVLLLFKVMGMTKIKGESRIHDLIRRTFWFLSIARNAIVVMIAICIAYCFKTFHGNIPFDITGKFKEGLPSVHIPPTSANVGSQFYSFIDMVKQLNVAIIIIPIMSIMTNIAIDKVYHQGNVIKANEELFALGLCNVAASFVGSLPVCGAITRGAIGHASNIQSPIAGIFTGIVTMLIISNFGPYFKLIPRATLSAVLITCVIFLINWPVMLPMWRSDKKDLLIMISTIILSLTFGLVKGLFLSIALSVIHLIYLWSHPKTTTSTCLTVSGYQYIEITPDKGLYFPSVANLRDIVLKQNNGTPIIINCKNFSGYDFTAMKELLSLVTNSNQQGRKIILKNTNTEFKRKCNTINTCNTVLAFCYNNYDLDKLLIGELHIRHAIKEKVKEETKDNKEGIPLMESCKIEIVGENKL